MNETILNRESTVEINALDNVPKEDVEHSIKSAWGYAKEGHVDYVRECLDEAEKDAVKIGYHIDENLKNDILRTALKRGMRRQLENAKLYANEKDLKERDRCLNSAEDFTREILNYQRSLKEIKSTIGNRIVYRIKYGMVSDEELQERFDKAGKTYDTKIKKYHREMLKKVEDTRKKLIENKPHSLRWFERFTRKSDEDKNQTEKTLARKDVTSYLNSMLSKNYEMSPKNMLDLSYRWAQEDSESGNVVSTKANIENIKKYSRELGAVVQDQELESILNTSYRNGTVIALKKAKRHAQRGIFSKAKAEVDEAIYYASNINSSVPTEEVDGILKTAYTKGMSKMLDRSMKMAEKGRVNTVVKTLNLTQECADYIGADISQKKDEILGTAYSNEIVRVFSETKKKAKRGMFDSVKRALKTIEFDASQIGRSVQTQKKNYLLRTAAKNGVLRELEKAEISHDAGEDASAKQYLKKAGKFADGILNYQRSLKEIKSTIGDGILYRLWYRNASDDKLQERFDQAGKIYDIRVMKDQEKLKKKIEKTKNELLSSKHSRFESIKLLHPA